MLNESQALAVSRARAFAALLCVVTMVASHATAHAQDAAAEAAKKLQNPLANIQAIMTDNTIGFDTGNDGGTSFGFQIQPVYAIDLPEAGFTFLPRGVIPIVGLEPGTRATLFNEDGSPVPGRGDPVWGLGDSIVQLFIAPHVEGDWKFGAGPQFSFATHTNSRLRGPDWGAGIAGVVTGPITEQISFAGIIANHWAFDGNFNAAMIQPQVYYNFESLPGAYVAYNAVTSIDWNAKSGGRVTLPLGFSVGRTLDLGDGDALDLMIGPYYNVIRPDGAAGWQIRFGASLLFG